MTNLIINDNQIPMFFGVQELMKILHISRTTAYALVKTKGFPCGRIGTRIVINKTHFLEWADKRFNAKHITMEKRSA